MKRKLLSLFAAIAMIFTIVTPVNINAAATPGSVWNAAELYYFLNYYGSDDAKVCSISGNTVTLKSDITLSNNLAIYPSEDMVLDLGTYSISTSSGITVSNSSKYGVVTIKGSADATTDAIKFTGSGNLHIYGDYVNVQDTTITSSSTFTASTLIYCSGDQAETFTNCKINTATTNTKNIFHISSSNIVTIDGCTISSYGSSSDTSYSTILVTNSYNYVPTVNITNSKITENNGTIVSIQGGITSIDSSTITCGASGGTENGLVATSGSAEAAVTLNNVTMNSTIAKVGVSLNNADSRCIISGDNTVIYGTSYAVKDTAGSLTVRGGTYGTTSGNFGLYVAGSSNSVSLFGGSYNGNYGGIACNTYDSYDSIVPEGYMTNSAGLTHSYTTGYNQSEKSIKVFAVPSYVELSKGTYAYDGTVKNPTVTVYDDDDNALVQDVDYTVSVPTGRKNVGKYKYVVTFIGDYASVDYTKSAYLIINPKATTISSLAKGTKSFTVKWNKVSTQCTGYQIQYSTSSSFTSPKTVTVTSYKTTSKTIKSLKAKKKYYVRVRTYKTVNGTKYYSAWSKSKNVTTK